jgi:tetratricopeptide (TPR) repeat protein
MVMERDRPLRAGGIATRTSDVLERAAAALQMQRPDEAERLAAEVLRAEPRHVRAHYLMGCALLMQRRAQDAIAPLETAARGRNDPQIEIELAIALRLTGRFDEALKRLNRLAKRQPPQLGAILELGILLVAMARYDEAILAFTRGIEIAPMMPRFSVELGYLFLRRRNFARAEPAFARALAISPDLPDALFGMAKAHQEIGNNEAAVPYFRRYLAIHPNDDGARLTFGHCLLELGRLDEGYEYFRKAGQGGPKCYVRALNGLVGSGKGRFWLKPSAAARYFQGIRG